MQLKLADYNAEGKFERFVNDFFYKSDGSQILAPMEKDSGRVVQPRSEYFDKDEKDPLNRFPDASGKGLFDGRSYGGGRFILVRWCGQEWEDSVYISEMPTYALGEAAILKYGEEEVSDDAAEIFSLYEHKGNLMENPELWEKVR